MFSFSHCRDNTENGQMKRMQWKIPRPSLERSVVSEEGVDLGLEGAGSMGAGWVLVGFLREE